MELSGCDDDHQVISYLINDLFLRDLRSFISLYHFVRVGKELDAVTDQEDKHDGERDACQDDFPTADRYDVMRLLSINKRN